MKAKVLGLLVLALGLGSMPVHAVPVTFGFDGTVTSTFFDPFDPFGGTIGFGTSIWGEYTFESTTPDAIPADPSVGSYSNFGAPFGMMVSIGGNSFSASEFLNIGVANDIGAGVDQYTVLAQEGTPFVDPDSLSIELFLEDPTGTALSSDDLPLSPLDVTQFLGRDFFLDGTATVGFDIFQFQIQGTITKMVPEPTTLALMGLGLAGLGYTRRRKTSS